MIVHEWLSGQTKLLNRAGIITARLDVLVMLADELQHDKSWVLAHPEYELQIEQLEKMSTKIAQRAGHTPLAYIRGHAEFYGRKFLVDEHVLVPRPESESLIELLKRQTVANKQQIIIDVGTGSGCLAITAKLEQPSANVFAIDIDENCLKIARENSQTLHANITLIQGDILQPFRQMTNDKRQIIILANLPYVPDDYPINDAARHEPKLALFSGKDGLDHYRKLFEQISVREQKPTIIITESLAEQHRDLSNLAKQNGYILQNTDGLAQSFRKV